MMLKIKTQNSWWIYDGLSRVHYGYGSDKYVKMHIKEGTWEILAASWNEFQPDVMHASPAKVETDADYMYPHWVSALRLKSNGETEETFIVFDEGYILNDDGKTIEGLR